MMNNSNAFRKTIKYICFVFLITVVFSLALSASAAGYPPRVTGFNCASLGSHTLQLKWKNVKNADGYIIYKAPLNSGEFKEIARDKFNGTYTVEKGVEANTGYRFAIKAYYTIGKVRYLSKSYPVVKVTTLPASVKNVNLQLAEQRILLRWSGSKKADGYRVYYSTNGGKNWTFYEDTQKTSLRKKDLKSGTKYIFGIKVYQYRNGTKTVSRDMPKVVKCTLPDTPNFTHARNGDLFHVNYAFSHGAQSYQIYTMVPGQKWVKQKTTVVKKGKTYCREAFTQKNCPKLYIAVRAVMQDGKTYYVSDYRKKLNTVANPKGTIISFGDSIAKGTGSHWWTHTDMFADKYNFKTMDHKYTTSGSFISAAKAKEDHLCDMVTSTIKKGADYSYIFLEGGRNDYYYGMKIGSVTPNGTTKFNKNTVCGSLETAFYHLKRYAPKSRVVFVLIHDCDNTSHIYNDAGYTFTDYANAIVATCKKYHVGVANVFANSGFNTGNKKLCYNCTFHYNGVYPDGDGVHPTEAAYQKYYLPQVEKAIKGLKPIGAK